MVKLRKQMLAPAEPVAERTLRWTISTGAVDREQDTISVKGWQLDNFKRNSVVLWGHDASLLPIGRAFDVGVVDGKALKASVKFVDRDTPVIGEFAEAVYQLASTGYLNATSVGFRPIKWGFTDDKERGADDWFPGIDFSEQELVELSIVTVPANPEALLEPMQPQPMQAPAIAQPQQQGEEVTAFNQERKTAREHRRRVLQLARLQLAISCQAHAF